MAHQNVFQLPTVDCVLLNELQNPGIVFRSSGVQGNRNEVVSRHYSDRNSLHRCLDRLSDRFPFQVIAGRQKLNRPTSDDYVFMLYRASVLS